MAGTQASPQSSPWDIYTDRASLYAQYRLDYAPELVAQVAELTGLQPHHSVADIGAGTGKLAQHFLHRACRVYCVEPNAAMRKEAEDRLRDHSAFVSVPGCAEATGLADGAVHLIVAGMALDWFDPLRALPEFQRVMHPAGWFAIFRYRVDQSYLQSLNRYLDLDPMRAPVTRPGSNDPDAYLSPGYITLEHASACEENWEQFIGGALSAASAPAARFAGGKPDLRGVKQL